ncbi:hypothetical protein LX36DRAFT_329744 [Colletotrichum falcatum]|nr:hypothetical protein LX36DRAFT_329744 [Colletotrichum falcatum]
MICAARHAGGISSIHLPAGTVPMLKREREGVQRPADGAHQVDQEEEEEEEEEEGSHPKPACLAYESSGTFICTIQPPCRRPNPNRCGSAAIKLGPGWRSAAAPSPATRLERTATMR